MLLKVNYVTVDEAKTQPAITCSKLIIETRCKICSKLIIKTVFIVNFEHISHLALVFLFLTLSR